MSETNLVFSDRDLLFLISILMPGTSDKRGMINLLREDEEILEGMLSDDKVLSHIMDDPESIIRVSPSLFFTVLLVRVSKDFYTQTYTIERDDRHTTVVFDGKKVIHLLQKKKIRNYLVGMLVSFVRINSFSTTVRVRKGIWRRYRFSDFDIDSLMQYSQGIEESQRFVIYKRIADICLFTLGVYSERIKAQSGILTIEREKPKQAVERNWYDYEEQGRYFYRAAAKLEAAQEEQMQSVLVELADNFNVAAKPLAVMASRYIGPFREKVFLQ